jgi:hypothetical protein
MHTNEFTLEVDPVGEKKSQEADDIVHDTHPKESVFQRTLNMTQSHHNHLIPKIFNVG